MRRWLATVCLAVNQLANALLGGDLMQTLSARAGLAREAGSSAARVACHVLDWVDPRDGDGPRGDHCQVAIDEYYQRLQQRLDRLRPPPQVPCPNDPGLKIPSSSASKDSICGEPSIRSPRPKSRG